LEVERAKVAHVGKREEMDFANLIDHRKRLACSGRHSHEHLMLASSDGLLDGSVRLALILSESGMVVRCLQKRLTGGVEIFRD